MKSKIETFFGGLAIFDALVGLLGVFAILIGSLIIQFDFHELPCTLCLLQRAGFIAVGLCFLMNLRYGHRTSHWGLAILCASVGIAVSIRQILLHINDPVGFGHKVWGMHLYTWSFFCFLTAIIGSALVLMFCSAKY